MAVIRDVFLLLSSGAVPNLVPSLAKLWIGLARRSVVLLVQCFNIFHLHLHWEARGSLGDPTLLRGGPPLAEPDSTPGRAEWGG